MQKELLNFILKDKLLICLDWVDYNRKRYATRWIMADLSGCEAEYIIPLRHGWGKELAVMGWVETCPKEKFAEIPDVESLPALRKALLTNDINTIVRQADSSEMLKAEFGEELFDFRDNETKLYWFKDKRI